MFIHCFLFEFAANLFSSNEIIRDQQFGITHSLLFGDIVAGIFHEYIRG